MLFSGHTAAEWPMSGLDEACCCETKRKEKTMPFRCQFNEKPSVILVCPVHCFETTQVSSSISVRFLLLAA